VSHDQRPGRMRVVQDPADAQRRRGDATTIEGRADTVAVAPAAAAAAAAAAADAGTRLPLLPAGLFLLACAAGGVLIAVIRPLGLG
jgi:hypothetical protein